MSAQLQSTEQLAELLGRHRKALSEQGTADIETRKRRIQTAIDLLVDCHQQICDAANEDFGGRHEGFTLMNDVASSIGSLKYARENLESWSQHSPRPMFPPYDELGATAWVQYQPKGTVGIIGTWNAPVYTLFSPLAGALAAGNRAVLKPSEVTPKVAEVLATAIAERFDAMDVAIINGGVEVGKAFAAMPFDHLVFTGSTSVGKDIMRAAAENLVPVTLELGGKSPVVIGGSADIPEAARRLAIAKGTNGGQLCISPDRVFVPIAAKDEFIAAFSETFAQLYPTVADNDDFVSVVNDHHMARIDSYIKDAEVHGATIVRTPDLQGQDEGRKRPLSIVVNPPLSADIMQHEIFGPALVVLTYADMSHVVEEINIGGRPLALYYFGKDQQEQDYVLSHTLSGGVTLNDAMMHPALDNAPFGGVGASGMGHYHGHEGFLEFSHARTVFSGAAVDPRAEWGMLPPYGEHFVPAMKSQITR